MNDITRLDPKERKSQLLDVALLHAQNKGLNGLRRDAIAADAGVSDGLVSRYFNTMKQLRRAVMRAAINRQILPIIAEGIALRDPDALKAPEELRTKALATLAS
jgi:AcrR family transcriptional regulator